jgi:hypothetical protein
MKMTRVVLFDDCFDDLSSVSLLSAILTYDYSVREAFSAVKVSRRRSLSLSLSS